jgi:hypothetical protein
VPDRPERQGLPEDLASSSVARQRRHARDAVAKPRLDLKLPRTCVALTLKRLGAGQHGRRKGGRCALG